MSIVSVKKKIKILLAGGGTLGPVIPLIAVAEEFKKRKIEAEFLFVGTHSGPEKKIVKSYDFRFISISSGKWRRYFSFWNFIDIFRVAIAFFQSFFVLWQFKPDLIFSAGGYVSVPLIYVAHFFKIKVMIHQQDVRPTLSNTLIAKYASIITVTFENSLNDFPNQKVFWVGNPVRSDILAGDKYQAKEIFHLEDKLPLLLVVGGGTGAQPLNKLIALALNDLLDFCQIIHLIGQNQKVFEVGLSKEKKQRYHEFDFLYEDLKHAFAVSDLVISRAGLSTSTELAHLGKPSIFIPIPDSHQVDNALYFSKRNAAIYLDQTTTTPEELVWAVKTLISDPDKLIFLAKNIKKMVLPKAEEKIVDLAVTLLREDNLANKLAKK